MKCLACELWNCNYPDDSALYSREDSRTNFINDFLSCDPAALWKKIIWGLLSPAGACTCMCHCLDELTKNVQSPHLGNQYLFSVAVQGLVHGQYETKFNYKNIDDNELIISNYSMVPL